MSRCVAMLLLTMLMSLLYQDAFGIQVSVSTTTMAACNESDPIDRIDLPPAPLHHSIGSMSPIALAPASTMSTDFRARPLNWSRSHPTNSRFFLLAPPLMSNHTNDAGINASKGEGRQRDDDDFIGSMSSNVDRDCPLVMARPLTPSVALIQSLFQHSHPILSRPTVPNIR